MTGAALARVLVNTLSIEWTWRAVAVFNLLLLPAPSALIQVVLGALRQHRGHHSQDHGDQYRYLHYLPPSKTAVMVTDEHLMLLATL